MEPPEAVKAEGGAPAVADLTAQIVALQRCAGNQSVVRMLSERTAIQRQPAPAAEPTAPAAPFPLGGVTIATYADAAVALGVWCSELEAERKALIQESVAVPVEIEATHKSGLDFVRVLEGGEAEPLDDGNGEELRGWHTTYVKAVNAGRAAQAAEAAARARAAANELQELSDKLAALEPALREVQRAAFRAGNEDGLLQTTDAIVTIVDTALVAKSAIEQTLDLAAELRFLGSSGASSKTVIRLANTTRTVLDALEKINKAWAAFQIARAAIDLLSGSKTDMEGGHKAVAAMATVMSAGGTLLNASAGFTLYNNLYIGPMTNACLAMLDKLEDLISKSTNRAWIELGKFEYVNWSLEPGGRSMFDFMLKVMRAASVAQVPEPVGAVDDYLVDQQDDFNAGVGTKGGEMPTQGWWLWEDTDSPRIQSWVFKNRDHLWGMLYGSAKVPTGAAF